MFRFTCFTCFLLSQISLPSSVLICKFHNYISAERWQDSIVLMTSTHVAVVAIMLIRQVTKALGLLLELEETIPCTQQGYPAFSNDTPHLATIPSLFQVSLSYSTVGTK